MRTMLVLLLLCFTVPGDAAELFVHWKMSENTGTIVADRGTCNCPGTLTNGPTWAAGPKANMFGVVFNGTTQFIVNASVALAASDPISVVGWFKTNSAAINNGAFHVGSSSTDEFGCHIPWNDNNIYCAYASGGNADWLGGAYSAQIGVWTHVAFTNNGSNARKLYVNNVIRANNTTTQTAPGAHTGLGVGRFQGGTNTFYGGTISDFRLYKGVLTDTEVAVLFNETAKRRSMRVSWVEWFFPAWHLLAGNW